MNPTEPHSGVRHSVSDGEVAELRLREISDDVVALRRNLDVYPGNQLLIDLLEFERATILEHYRKVIQ